MLRFPASVLLIGLATAFTTLGASITVFGTGESSGGGALPVGQTDPHYTLISAPTGVPLTAITTTPNPVWIANTAMADWITPSGSASASEPLGDYDFQTTFDLTGFDSSTAQLTGRWTSDNNGCIFLNGANTGDCTGVADFGSLFRFSITSGFQTGVNRLDFIVTNATGPGLNPTGVIAEVSGTVTPISGTTPEPSALWLVSAGAGFIALMRARHSKAC